jgi:hypothetical protein
MADSSKCEFGWAYSNSVHWGCGLLIFSIKFLLCHKFGTDCWKVTEKEILTFLFSEIIELVCYSISQI